MRELSDSLEAVLAEKGLGSVVEDVKTSLLDFGLHKTEVDIEAIFTVLDSLINPETSIRNAGPLACYLASKIPDKIPAKPELEELKAIAQEVITEICLKIEPDRINKYYTNIFDELPQNKNIKFRAADGTQREAAPGYLIATTNYDLAVEEYLRRTKRSFNDGFYHDDVEGIDYFNSSHVRTQTITLIKLHGSIDWFLRSDGRVEKLRREPTGRAFRRGEEYKGKMMVYPVHEKYVSKGIFADLFTSFRRALHESYLCVAIGYSFRDQAINNAFSDSLSENKPSRLVIIGPHAGQACVGLKSFGVPMKKVSIIERKIEEPEVWQELKTVLGHPPGDPSISKHNPP